MVKTAGIVFVLLAVGALFFGGKYVGDRRCSRASVEKLIVEKERGGYENKNVQAFLTRNCGYKNTEDVLKRIFGK